MKKLLIVAAVAGVGVGAYLYIKKNGCPFQKKVKPCPCEAMKSAEVEKSEGGASSLIPNAIKKEFSGPAESLLPPDGDRKANFLNLTVDDIQVSRG